MHEEHNPSEPLSRGTSVAPHAGAEHIALSPVGRWYATAVKHLQEDGATDELTISRECSRLWSRRSRGRDMTEHHDKHTMERMREHLARADSELETAQHFLDPGSGEGAEMDLVRAIASAREDIGEALETVRWRLGEPEG